MVRTRWTTRDLELLPDSLEDKRYEIIDGELHVARQPHYYHQRLCARLAAWLERWSEASGAGETAVAPSVIFAEDDNVAPDIVWIAAHRVSAVVGADGKLHSAPDLIVELLSPGPANEQRDREAKLMLYSRRGVREYWIVDWRARQVEVYRRMDLALHASGTLLEDDTLESPLLPRFTVSLRDLFAGIPAVAAGE